MEFLHSLHSLVYVCPLLFLAGFVDAIAGGGGLIAMPAYVMTGMPMHMAYGCNKLQSAMGTGFAVRQFIKNKMIDFRIAIISAVFALAGSALATRIVLYLPDHILKKMLLVILPVVAILIIFKSGMKDTKEQPEVYTKQIKKKDFIEAAILGITIGMYDGLFGPGGGMIALFLYKVVMKFDIRTASGNAKLVILISNCIALIYYMKSGNILYEIAIPATIFNMAGNYFGSRCAISKGARVIRPAMSTVAVLLLVKTVIDFM